jgi:N-terminal half of MaoC dehydratase
VAGQLAPGDVLASFEMQVELGKIREFARATQSSHPSYTTDACPAIPPTFLAVAALWQPSEMPRLYEALGMDLHRVLHGEQEFCFYGKPIRAGDRLRVTVRLESVVTKAGRRGGSMRFGKIVTDFTDVDGRLAARAWSTTIETEAA